MKVMYTAEVKSSGGRKGHVVSSDKLLDFPVSLPTGLGGDGKSTNPEQLFAAGYAACFGSAMAHVASSHSAKPEDIEVLAKVSIGSMENKLFKLAVKLEVSAKNISQSELDDLVQKAHQVCPYSNATRNNIEVELLAKAIN